MHFRSGFNPFRKMFSFGTFVDEGADDAGGTGTDKTDKSDKTNKSEEEEPSEEELAELAKAKDILRIFKDPAARKAFVISLAKQEGITEDSTKKEVKDAARTIKSIVKKHMGSDYEILSDKLEGMLSEFSDLIDEERIKPVREGLTKSETTRIQNEAAKGYDEAIGEYSNAKELEPAIAKLTEEIRPTEGQSAKSYFKRLLIIAAEEKGIKLTKKDAKSSSTANFSAARRDANRKDASSRLASEGADDGKVERKSPKQFTNLDDAIAAAAKDAEAILKG